MKLLNVISSKDLKSSDKLILIYLNEIIGNDNKKDLRLDDISEATGMSRPTILNATKKLYECGYIDIKKNVCPYGSIRPNTYILLRGKINEKN